MKNRAELDRREGRVVVIQQRTPRGSMGNVEASAGAGAQYSYGEGPVRVLSRTRTGGGVGGGVGERMDRRISSAGGVGLQPVRSASSRGKGHSPRQSGVSVRSAGGRSTRERVMIVDEAGSRREYYR